MLLGGVWEIVARDGDVRDRKLRHSEPTLGSTTCLLDLFNRRSILSNERMNECALLPMEGDPEVGPSVLQFGSVCQRHGQINMLTDYWLMVECFAEQLISMRGVFACLSVLQGSTFKI